MDSPMEAGPGWFRQKILLGLAPRAYVKSLLTPWNLAAAALAAAGLAILAYRFARGLGAATHLSQVSPWGLWIGFDMMSGIVLAAGGFTIGAAVELFGLEEFRPVERPALLTGFLGYLMAVGGLVADLGRPWNMFRVIWTNGSASVLFEVAWCVMCYTSVLALEFTVPLFEWLGWKRLHSAMKKALLALTVLSVVLSTMHQSALGSVFLIAPGKLHPLWYSPFIFVFFFATAVAAGIAMVIVESSLSHRVFAAQFEGQKVDVEKITLGLGKAGAVVLFASFFLRVQGVIDGHAWNLLATGWGVWFLLEVVGFLLFPSLLFAWGARNRRPGAVRAAAWVTVAGMVLYRLNVAVIAMNWNRRPRYFPSWMEIVVSLALVTIGVLAFRWIVNRMPVLRPLPESVGAGIHGEEMP